MLPQRKLWLAALVAVASLAGPLPAQPEEAFQEEGPAAAAAQPGQPPAKLRQAITWAVIGLNGLALLPATLVSAAAVAALLALCAALCPRLIRREQEVLQESFWGCWWRGLVWGVGLFLVSVVLTRRGEPGGGLAGLLLLVASLGAVLGLAGAASFVGRSVLERADRRSGSLLAAVVLGSVVLFLSVLVPLIGWGVGLFFLILSLGALWRASRSLPPHVPLPLDTEDRPGAEERPVS